VTSNNTTGSDPITLDPANLAWFVEDYGTTEWCVYFPGMDEITAHDRHYPGNGTDPAVDDVGKPFTEETIRAYLAEFNARFGPGSPLAVELQDPSYAVAVHYGKPAFWSHDMPTTAWFFASIDEAADSNRTFTTLEAAKHAAIIDWESGDTGPGIPPPDYSWITDEKQPNHHVLLDDGVVTGWWVQPVDETAGA